MYLLVLIELVIQFAMCGRNDTKGTVCVLLMCMKEVKCTGLYRSEIGFQFVDVDAIQITALLVSS